MDKSQKHYPERKKPNIHGSVLYDSISMKFRNRQILFMVAKKSQQRDCLWEETGLAEKEHKGNFWSRGNVLYVNRGLDYTVYIIVKAQQTYP